jgi:Flp pilus assembly pilin Flp
MQGSDDFGPASLPCYNRGRLDAEETMSSLLLNLWLDQQGQDIAEYSVMLAVVLVIVVGTVRLIGSNASNIFSQVGSSIQ